MPEYHYPTAVRQPDRWQCGAHEVQDAYLYMQDAKKPEVYNWVAQENAYTDRWFESTKLEERIRFLKEKKKKPAYHQITEQNGMLYAGKTNVDGSVSAVLLDQDFHEQKTLLDRKMLEDRMQVYGVSPCPADDDIAAFSVLKDGAPRMSVIVRNINSNTALAELDGTFSFTWSADGAYVYSSTASQRPDGTTENSVIRWCRASGKVETVYTWQKHAVFLRLSAAPTNGIFVHVCQDYHDTLMVYLDAEGSSTQVFPETNAKIEYIGTIADRHYFLTDHNAPLGKVVAVEHEEIGLDSQEIVPQGRFPLEGACTAGENLLLIYLQDGACSLNLFYLNNELVHNQAAKGSFSCRKSEFIRNDTSSAEDFCQHKSESIHKIELPDELGSVSFSAGHSSADTPTLYLEFESFVYPPSVLKYDIESGETQLTYCTREEMPAGITAERKFLTAHDGQQIMAFLVHKEGMQPTGTTPTLMYGYGGYSVSQLPWYNNPFVGLDIPDWVERGGLYVHCILRGGEEYGAQWHEAGCRLNKKNVFYDFIDIAGAVIADGWTAPEHIAVCGGSNGGLLVTALMTMAPELWKCVIASVPHTDMLHFCCDDRGPMYVTEYGDPREEEFFEYMKSYSPYHNIKPETAYPAAYIQTGEQDNNVPAYHGKKFAAAMQQATTGGPVLLRVLPFGSHDRGAGEYFYRTVAEMQTFIETALKMTR